MANRRLYFCYETLQKMTKANWEKFYKKEVNHEEYKDFSEWWHDMMKMNLLSVV